MPNPKKAHRKNNIEISLSDKTTIYQSNRVTHSRSSGLTLLQARIFVCLIKELQEAIIASMNGKNWQQLDLFQSENAGMIRVAIPLKLIAKPRQYAEVYQSAIQLAKASILLPSTISKEYFSVATLFPKVDLPKRVNGASLMYVELYKATANLLIEIDKTGNGKPGYFTKYLFEVAMRARNKYTYKIYMIISSWRTKGIFTISIEDLKRQLGIGTSEYQQYKEFKKRVLIPVKKELENKSDTWFAFAECRQGRKVVALQFRIITPPSEQVSKERVDHIKYLLTTHLGFTPTHIKAIEPFHILMSDQFIYQGTLQKIQDLNTKIFHTPSTGKITNKANYALASLMNYLSASK